MLSFARVKIKIFKKSGKIFVKWWGFVFFRLLRRIYDSPRNDEKVGESLPTSSY